MDDKNTLGFTQKQIDDLLNHELCSPGSNSGLTPKQAANKALTKLLKQHESKNSTIVDNSNYNDDGSKKYRFFKLRTYGIAVSDMG